MNLYGLGFGVEVALAQLGLFGVELGEEGAGAEGQEQAEQRMVFLGSRL